MVALLGLILAIIALASNLVLAWLKVPRIVVQVSQTHRVGGSLTVGPGNPLAPPPAAVIEPDTFTLTVINNGSEAITVRTIGLKSDVADGGIELDWDLTARTPSATYPQPEGATLPVRIDGHGCEVWTYEDNALASVPPGDKVFGFAVRYKMFRLPGKRNRALDKRHYSERTVYRRNAGLGVAPPRS